MAFDRINATYTDDNLGLAKELTDKKYATRSEIVSRFGGPVFSYNGDMVWNAVVNYREKYIYPLSLPGYSNQLFRCHLSPTIMSNFITTDRVMMHLSNLYNQYKIHDYVCACNITSTFNKSYLAKELFAISNDYRFDLDEADIYRNIIAEQGFAKPELDNYVKALNFVKNSKASSIDARFIRNIAYYMGLTTNPDTPVYRTNGVKDTRISIDLIDESKSIYSSNGLGKIQELVNALFSFYNTQYSLSPVTMACIMYSMFVYIAPLEKYNLEVANLLFMKVLDERGYGDVSYSIFFDAYINRNLTQFNSYLKESKNTSDLTYMMLFVCSMAKSIMENCVNTLAKEPLPALTKGEVREVIKEVVKEIPVEVIKEVEVPVEKIVEVPVDRVVEVPREIEIIKEVPVEVEVEKYVEKIETKEVIIEKEIEIPVEIIKEVPVVKEIIKSVPVEVIKEVEVPVEKEVVKEVIIEKEIEIPVEKEIVKFVEKIVEVPVEVIVEKIIEVPTKREVEVIVEKEVEVPVEKEVIRYIDREVPPSRNQQMISSFTKPAFNPTAVARVNVNDLSNLSDDEYAQRLLVLIPTIRKDQAFFYAHHRTEGCFYTIGQYKEYADCAYETARTSMDFLVTCGFYRKELLKNKYVYTPVSSNHSEGEENVND